MHVLVKTNILRVETHPAHAFSLKIYAKKKTNFKQRW